MTQDHRNEPELLGKPRALHEKKHISQSQLEVQALCRLFRSTGGSSTDQEPSSWKKQTGWSALEHAAKQSSESLLVRGTMETQFPLDGVVWERNHVVAIDLSENGLSGRLPSDITHLRFLKTLKLRNNPKLMGCLPPGMYSMPHLRYCYLDGTKLEKTLPFQTAHSFQITHFHASGAAATVCFLTNNRNSQTRWTADITESEMFMMHSSLKALHERPATREAVIECNARNATGPERAAAAIKLQRIYRARIERSKFRKYLKSLFERNFDPNSGFEYFVDTRTGEASWEKPTFIASPRNESKQLSDGNNDAIPSAQNAAAAWQPYDDGCGNTVSFSFTLNPQMPHQTRIFDILSPLLLANTTVLLEQHHGGLHLGTASLPQPHLPGTESSVWSRQNGRRTLRTLLPRY